MARRTLAMLALFSIGAVVCGCECGSHAPPRFDGGTGSPDAGTGGGTDGGVGTSDTGTHVADTGAPSPCTGRGTHVTGTAYAPNGMDPIPGVAVYVTSDTQSFPPTPATVQCDVCTSTPPGALVFVRANADGTFDLHGAPIDGGGTYAVVVESGGFRHVEHGVSIPMCGDLALDATATSLPGANAGDDRIPRIAVATTVAGSPDTNDHFAHVLDLMGITYTGINPDKGGTPLAAGDDMFALLSDPATLATYQILVLPCGSLGNFTVAPHLTPAMLTNLQAWMAMGGRLYSSDLAYSVVALTFPTTVTFAPGPSPHAGADDADVGQGIASTATLMADVDDPSLLAWLQLVGAVPSTSTQIPISDLRDPWGAVDQIPAAALAADAMGVHHAAVLVSGDVTWHVPGSGHHPLTVQADYPNGSGGWCGRMVFTSYHVQTGTAATLAPQERVLEYLFFQLSGCIPAAPF
jgi:hypothetical protein